MNTVPVFSAAWSLNISKLSRIALVVDMRCIHSLHLAFLLNFIWRGSVIEVGERPPSCTAVPVIILSLGAGM